MKARRWDEIMRIASTQVVVTAKIETVDGQVISIRQSTEAESKYDLLYITPEPLGKRKSMLHPNQTSKIRILEIRELHNGWLQCGLNRYSVKPNSPKAKPKLYPGRANTFYIHHLIQIVNNEHEPTSYA